MDQFIKRLIIVTIMVLALLGIASYIGYRFYEYAVQDATERIQAGVSSGVSEGVQEGVGGMINPINMAKKFFSKK